MRAFTTSVGLRAATFGVVAISIAGLPAVAATAASHSPKLTASPHKHLKTNESVAVTGKHFADNSTYFVFECNAFTGASACEGAAPATGLTSATGGFTNKVTVTTGTSSGDCAVGGKCYLIATTDASKFKGASTARERISFGKGKSTAPKVTVTPHSGVKKGEKVKVTGVRFPKSQTFYVAECSGKSSEAQCDVSDIAQGTTSSKGTFSTKFKIVTGSVGNGTCKAGKTCYLAATTSTTGAAADTDTAKITFKK